MTMKGERNYDKEGKRETMTKKEERSHDKEGREKP
jgi:hypothetical protein